MNFSLVAWMQRYFIPVAVSAPPFRVNMLALVWSRHENELD